ncbi:MAG: GtrA family protein [Stenotrophomonas sp.]
MNQRLLRFLISGGSAAGVEYATFIALQLALGSSWLLASQSISFGCGFIVSFALNRRWVFQSSWHLGSELTTYGLVAAINLGLGNLAIYMLTGPAEVHPLLAKFAVMGMIAGWNYRIFSRFVFRKSA